MIIRGVGRTILGLALVMGAAACDDNPLSEGRETGSYFSVNPTNSVVQAGDTTRVTAIVMNRYGAPINAPVTAEPCDAKVTAMADPRRSALESPETFIVVGQTLGFSCIVVRGGGLIDTATIRVVPASVEVVGDTLIQSGEVGQVTVRFLNIQGQPVTGFDINSVTLTTGSSTIAGVDETGAVSGRAPGTTPVIATLNNTWGVVRADSLEVRVQAGTFTGTFSPTNPFEGSIMTITAGALAFDDDTHVIYDGEVWPWLLSRTTTTLTIVTPPSGDIVIGSIGENQVALNATIPIQSHEPADNGTGTTRVLAETDSMWFSVGGTFGTLDLARLVVPAGGGTYRFTLDWAPNDGYDLDVVFFNSAGGFMGYGGQYGGCATAGKPEGCTLTLAAGTWYPAVDLYEGDFTTAKLTIVKQ